MVFSFCVFPQTAAVCTAPHFARLICFRYDRRDFVTTRSVCGHLCPHQWHSAEGGCGKCSVLASSRGCAVFWDDDVLPVDRKEFFFKRSSNLSQDSSKNNKTIVFHIYNETPLCLLLYCGFKFTCLWPFSFVYITFLCYFVRNSSIRSLNLVNLNS